MLVGISYIKSNQDTAYNRTNGVITTWR